MKQINKSFKLSKLNYYSDFYLLLAVISLGFFEVSGSLIIGIVALVFALLSGILLMFAESKR